MHKDYESTITAIKSGGVILCPTDTVWGLSCDAFNESAVTRLYEIKKRNRNKPLILLVSSIEMLKEYIPHLHPRIENLLYYHKRPLSVIYDNPTNLPNWVIASNNSVAIRIVQDSYIKNLIERLGSPITSSSANIEGEPTPDEHELITKSIINKVDFQVPRNYENDMIRSSSVIISYDKKGEISLVR